MPQAAPAAVLERIQATSTPIAAPSISGSGTLVRWLKKPGEKVGQYEPLAEVAANGLATALTSTTAGVVKALMVREGARIGSGDVLCYIQPAEASPSPAQGGQRDPAPFRAVTPPPPPAPASTSRAASREPLVERNGSSPEPRSWTLADLPEMEELTFDDVEPPKPKQRQTAKPKPTRGKTTHKTYHLEEGQVQRIKRLSLELKLDAHAPVDCNESELVRAAVEMLLELPRPALRAVIKANREREKAGRYGSGWPRPGKN